MSQITIHIHAELAESLLADHAQGTHVLAAISRQALSFVQTTCGRQISYARPMLLPNGMGYAMSVRGGARGLIVEIDLPGAAIAGRFTEEKRHAAKIARR